MQKTRLSKAILVSVLTVAALTSCKPRSKAEAPAQTFGAAPVKVFKAVRMKISEKLFYTGTIEARQKVNLTPDVGGKIARILVNEGDRVSQGQVLAELDAEEIGRAHV